MRCKELETKFTWLLERMAPNERDALLFEEAVRRLHADQQNCAVEMIRNARKKLTELDARKNQLVDFFLERNIDQSTYDGRVKRLDEDIQQAPHAALH